MKKPVMPFPPMPFEYEEKIERKYIYRCTESLQEDEYDDEDEDDEPKEVPKKPIAEVDLAWLLTQVPEGIDPSQIKIEFYYHASCMAYEDHHVHFYYEVTIPARKAEYDAARKKFEADKKQYDKDVIAWEEEQKNKKIKNMEKELKKLKGEE
jgi:hypothetical protein